MEVGLYCPFVRTSYVRRHKWEYLHTNESTDVFTLESGINGGGGGVE